jgi:hypothetical protein
MAIQRDIGKAASILGIALSAKAVFIDNLETS